MVGPPTWTPEQSRQLRDWEETEYNSQYSDRVRYTPRGVEEYKEYCSWRPASFSAFFDKNGTFPLLDVSSPDKREMSVIRCGCILHDDPHAILKPMTEDSEDDRLARVDLRRGQIVNISPKGDLVFKLKAGIQVRVESSIMRSKFSVFDAMLGSNMREGRANREVSTPHEVPLPADSVDSVIRLCQIAHGVYILRNDQGMCREYAIGLAQLFHKYGCSRMPVHLINGMIHRIKCPKFTWSRVDDMTLHYFLENEMAFGRATGLYAALKIYPRHGTMNVPTPELETRLTSRDDCPSFLAQNEEEVEGLLDDANEAFRRRFLANLRTVKDIFMDNRECWFVKINPMEDHRDQLSRDDEPWLGQGPPQMLAHFLDHWHEYPYTSLNMQERTRSPNIPDSQHATGPIEPSTREMIKRVLVLNDGADNRKHVNRNNLDRFDIRGWFPHEEKPELEGWYHAGLYLKSNDGTEMVLYFYEAVKYAIWDACYTIDLGICLKYAHNPKPHLPGECLRYPCWDAEKEPLNVHNMWKLWDVEQWDWMDAVIKWSNRCSH